MRPHGPHPIAALCLALAAAAPAACSDPSRERALAELGPEDQGGPSPNHRRGQPCLLCHDATGGAKPEMVVAGTVYATPAADADGADDVEVQFVDASGGGPLNNPFTLFPSGNFYVKTSDWPDLAYPFKVRLLKNGQPVAIMTSTVNREGSCNFCHRPNPPEPYTDEDRERARRSYGQIYVGAAPSP